MRKKFLTLLLSVTYAMLLPVYAADLNYINVKNYNATGDGTTNDLSAINSAISACVTQKNLGEIPVLYFPPATSYCVNGQVTVPSGISVRMEAPIEYTGTSDIAVLVLEGGAFLEHKLSVIRKNWSDWSSENNIAIKIKNCYNSKITVTRATRSTIGVQMIGDAAGFVYNIIEPNYIIDNKIGIDLTNVNNGWANENLFLKGRFSLTSSAPDDVVVYGIRINSIDGSYEDNNNNLFIHPNFELSPVAVPVLVNYGQLNEVIGARDEGNSSVFAKTYNDSSNNVFNLGYGNGIVEDNGTYKCSVITYRKTPPTNCESIVFDSGNLVEKACLYDNSKINISGVLLAYPTNGSIYKAQNYISINSDYVEFTYGGVGILVDSAVNKDFTVQKSALESYGGRLYVRCYDVNDNLLTGSSPMYVKSQQTGNSFYYSSNYGGAYSTGADSHEAIAFKVDDAVKKIAVLLTSGTNSLRLRSFKIIGGRAGAAAAWPGYEQIIPGVNLGTQAPVSGTWTKGRLVLNDNKIESGSAGSKYVIDAWECIQSGTPGTWIQKRTLTGN